ncbi:class F sortase [Nocardioides marmoribigeumensis]|uniref:LPXTG-site transpeptidase (Sortase) family protein n=1 Tax=Nocardioides marmoribigeumensis TaxID=433649 RepID=A0ABU2BXT6_9ACTN|nr:class F sortase [Nocardioides marmoribigeumensis]MDR7363213.1 LPXTG-site transpeptidase (sortase) family protein [Nocardioides marmoribigeumensis]
MSTPPGSTRTLAGDLATLRAEAATRPGASLAVVAALLCSLVSFGTAAFTDLDEDTPLTAAGHDVAFPELPGENHHARHGRHHTRPAAQSPMLKVARLHVDAPIVPIALQDDGVLAPPADVDHVGWWDASAGAGAKHGQTVLTGHTVHEGGGVMNDLARLTEGDLVSITDQGGEVDYKVTRVVTWSKRRLARRAVEVFGQDRHHGRLVMVTCADWDGKTFDSNVIAFAQPTGPLARPASPEQEARAT